MTSKHADNPVAILSRLLASSMSEQELRRFLHTLHGDTFSSELPGAGTSVATLTFEAVLALERRGLVDERLFQALAEHAPGRLKEIRAASAAWGLQLKLDATESTPLPQGLVRVDSMEEQSSPDPKRFFIGHVPTWADLSASVDVRRSVIQGNALLQYQEFLSTLKPHSELSNLLVVFGEGGSGKTTFLRRLMYDLSQAGAVVLRSRYEASINPSEVVRYLHQIGKDSSNPAYIFFDDAQQSATRIFSLAHELSFASNRVLIIAAARRNEWNSATSRLRGMVYESVFLPRLNETEARQLLDNLARYNALGKLDRLSEQEQMEAITIRSESQLLVALLEATQGKRFREIVLDEFRGISDPESRLLYLAICLFSQLGLRTPERAAALITRATSTYSFLSETLPLLELVVSREDTRRGVEFSPRHRLIADELIQQACPDRIARLKTCLDGLERMSDVDRPEKTVQNFAVKLGHRLLRDSWIMQTEEGLRTVELLLSAGARADRQEVSRRKLLRRFPAFKARQGTTPPVRLRLRPTQDQFRVCIPILRRLSGDDDAILLIQEGLTLNRYWNHLRLEWAIIESTRGNNERAEQILENILAHQAREAGKIVLPIPLAVDVAHLKKEKGDHQTALTLLEMAEPNIQPEMVDTKQYFLNLAYQYEALKRPEEAIDTLKKGLKYVKEPRWAIENLERALSPRLVQHRPGDFLEWVKNRYGDSPDAPFFITKSQLEHAITLRDSEAVKNTFRRASRGKEVLLEILRHHLEQQEFESADFVMSNIDPNELSDDLLRALINLYEKNGDDAGIKRIAEHSNRGLRFLQQLAQSHAEKGELDAFQFFSRALGEEPSREVMLLITLESALTSGQEERITQLIAELRTLGKMSPGIFGAMMRKAIAGHHRELVVEILRHVDDPVGWTRGIRQAHLKQGGLSALAFVDDVFGRYPLEPWLAMLLLQEALKKNDEHAAIDLCSRIPNLSDVFSMLRKRLKFVDASQEDFLKKIENAIQGSEQDMS